MNKQQLINKRQWLSRVLASQIAFAASSEYDETVEQDISNIMNELDEISILLSDLQNVSPLPIPDIVVIDDLYWDDKQQQFNDELDELIAQVAEECATKKTQNYLKMDMWNYFVNTVADFPVTEARRKELEVDPLTATSEEFNFLVNLDSIFNKNLNITLSEIQQLVNSTK